MLKKKFYITTSVVYTNALPHLGFALEVIQADVLARYHRLLGKDVFFSTGTDEHGAKNVKAAKEAGMDPKEFVDKITERFKELRKTLNLSYNDFIRTTDQKRHWPSMKKVWLNLKEAGDIYKKAYKGLYCPGCEAFITKKDLINGKCYIHKKKPDVISEENYFFRLSKYSKKIEKIIKKEEIKVVPSSRKNEILNFIKQGLNDVSFSRPRKDLKWAVPVPDDKEASVYVWAEALTNYISVLNYYQNSIKFKRFWPADIHCIGKDILRFHAAIWPGMLLSLGLPLPKTIFVHGFITVDNQKMSKSLGNIIDPFELVKKYKTDPVRYFLLREIPSTEDGDFTYEKLEKRYSADLSGGLGNLIARVLTMAEKSGFKDGNPIPKNKEFINKTWKKYEKALKEFKFNMALSAIWELISFADQYIEKEKPWEESKNQTTVINNLLIILTNIAFLLQPFLPETSEKIFKQLGVKSTDKKWKFKIKKGKILFPRI
tara:strand:- start:284 stop:1744 length:1461 start_codon:yes stop_codon:yes gene_type:complete